jgi:hypothetical protein
MAAISMKVRTEFMAAVALSRDARRVAARTRFGGSAPRLQDRGPGLAQPAQRAIFEGMLKLFKSHAPRARAPKPATPEPAPKRPVSTADLARAEAEKTATSAEEAKSQELGGPAGPEPTRYGDWERKGICYDF